MKKYTPFIPVLAVLLLLACSVTEETGPGEIHLDFRNAVFTGNSVQVPENFAGFNHTGYSYFLDEEYELMRTLHSRWIHQDFSWGMIQPDVPIDHPRFNDFEYLANRFIFSLDGTGRRGDFDEYVRRANEEGMYIMGMLLYDTPWVHRKHRRPPGHPFENRVTFNEQTGRYEGIREVREEQIEYFVRYAVETVRRYNGNHGFGKVDAWFIWNEPCLQPRFWTGTRDEFFNLTARTVQAIRELDEEEGTHTVLVGGVFSPHVLADLNNWIEGFFACGTMYKLDGIGFHPYAPSSLGSRAFFDTFQNAVRPHGFADRIWLNEMGFPTYTPRGPIPPGRLGTDQYEWDMPEVVPQTFALLAAAGAKNLTWYHLFERRAVRDNNNSEHWFGLVWKSEGPGGDPYTTWKINGGFWGYAISAEHIPGKTWREVSFPDIPEGLHVLYFEGSGRRTLLVWNSDPLDTFDVRISLPGRNFRTWDLVEGGYDHLYRVSTHRLYPPGSDLPTTVFITWEE